MRKTYDVDKLKDEVNIMLLNSTDGSKNEREELIILIESVLMETKNYKGFHYLSVKDMEGSQNGISVGIIWDGNKATFEGTDHTRVHYF